MANYQKLLPAAAAILCVTLPLRSQTMHTGGGTVIVPESSIARPGDAGKRMRTSVRIFVPDQAQVNPSTTSSPPVGESPASLACIYKLVAGTTKTCNQATTTALPAGGSGAIAIVDAYHDPTATSDLAAFSSYWGLPAANFKVVYAAQGSSTQTTTPPPVDSTGGWEFEESIDIEMAHSFAPKAKLYLVEAYSNNNSDLFPAVQLAANLVAAAGGGEVSMSWYGDEFSSEAGYDATFTTPGVVYFACAGDNPGVYYPCASADVVCVGGTTISRNATTGNFEQQSAWYDTGGGLSAYEPIPGFQSGISSIVGTQRGVPDVAAVADTRTPVWVYDSNALNGQTGPWWLAGGTSVATPLWAGIANLSGRKYTSSNAELTAIYSELGVTTDFADIVAGNCGVYAGLLAQKGWDFCTGVGINVGRTGK